MAIPTFNLDMSFWIVFGLVVGIVAHLVAALLNSDVRAPNVGEVLLGVGLIGFYVLQQHLPWRSW